MLLSLGTDITTSTLTIYEEIVADVWFKMLGVKVESTNISFFEAGGNSINVISIVQILNQKFPSCKLDVKMIFKLQSLRRIALYIETGQVKSLQAKQSTNSLADEPDDLLLQTKLSVRPIFKERPLKIVCLHGAGSSANVFSLQLQQVVEQMGSTCEFSFIEAKTEIKGGNAYLSKFYDSDHWYTWVGSKYFGTKFLSKRTMDKALNDVIEQLHDIGPVDALLGFSQGAAMIEMLDRKAQAFEIPKTWNFSILMSGMPIKSLALPKSYTSKVEGGIKSSALVVTGAEDRDATLHLMDRYNVNYRQLMEHDKGHEIPKQMEFTRNFADKIFRMAVNERKRKNNTRTSLDDRRIVTSVVDTTW
ncbi:serine hydrolase-domain-containing protein [Globomyces pollinis-pini]|nr:serine hydrolase-domain-containing protein [Globomyces pollinis-pini]